MSWNTRELLRACLLSLAPEQAAGRAEVWVVDNGSSDGSPDLVRAEFPWARLVEPGRNLGFGPAVNLVAERSEGDWIAPSNADVELMPGALELLLDAGARHPEAGALAPRLEHPDGSVQHSAHAFPTIRNTALFNLGAQRLSARLGHRLLLEGYWDSSREQEVDWAVGAFLLVRRRAFDDAGAFDPGQWMYAEDLDLGWRLARRGWTTVHVPAARVLHAESAAAAQAFGEARAREERWMAATYAWMVRRRGLPATWAYALLNVAGAAVRWAIAVATRDGPRRALFAHWVRVNARGLRPRRGA